MTGLSLLDVLELLNYAHHELDESFQLCEKPVGGAFTATVMHTTPETLSQDRDVWFGPNPVRWNPKPAGPDEGRPTAAHVTRLAAVWADLDVKATGCPDFDTARLIVDDLAGLVGTPPVCVTYSGHGLQPLWAVEDGEILPDRPGIKDPGRQSRGNARALLRRWGRLVAAVAERRGSKVDTVYDLPRILRAPRTVNHKGEPLPVVTQATHGAPLAVEQIVEVLDEYGIPDLPDDHADPGTVVSAPADWTWRDPDAAPCSYLAGVVAGWRTDDPNDRHPWLVAQATRIAVLHRNGCLTPDAHQRLTAALTERFRALISAGGQQREPGPGEIADAFSWGQQRAAAMSADQVASEVGRHLHAEQAGEKAVRPSGTRPVLTVHQGGLLDSDGANALAPAAPAPQLTSHTDRGNADLIVARHRHRLRWAPSMGAWLRWDGCRWQTTEDHGEALQAAIESVEAIEPVDDEARKHKKASLSRRALEAAVMIARTDPAISAPADRLDADPWALNTPGGIVDLRTGQVRPCDPVELHTQATAVPYEPDAAAPRFRAFLEQTFDGDQAMIGYLQRLAGYSAAGIVTHHVLPFLHGGGGNGKSVFLDVVTRVLGTYAAPAPPGFLLAGGRQDESAIARLKGLRLVYASEVNQTDKFDEAKVKMLTGGDAITARHLYARHFTFIPSHTLWLMGNHQPRVQAGGESFWRRLRLIPFTRTVPAAERVENLARIIIDTEGPGVLAWIVEGARQALSGGLREPAEVIAATADYAAEEDHLGRFVEERLRVGGGQHVRVDQRLVRDAYEAWCREESEQALPPSPYGRELRTRFAFESVKSNGRRFYVNLSLIGDPADENRDSKGQQGTATRADTNVRFGLFDV